MIKIIFKNVLSDKEIGFSNNKLVYIEVTGHSGLGTRGNDILCAAVSALTQTFVVTVSRILNLEQKLEQHEGYLSSQILLDAASDDQKSKLTLLIESLIIGLYQISSEYPDKIKIEFVND